GRDQVFDELGLADLDILGFGDGIEDELGAQVALGLLGDLGAVLVIIETVLGLEVTLDLVVDDLGRNGTLEGLDEVLEDLVACLHALVGLLLLAGLLAQVLTQFGDRIELTGQLGEVVVGLGQFALLDR